MASLACRQVRAIARQSGAALRSVMASASSAMTQDEVRYREPNATINVSLCVTVLPGRQVWFRKQKTAMCHCQWIRLILNVSAVL